MFYSNLLKSLTLILAASIYCAPLPKHDDSITAAIASETRKAVIAANDDDDDTTSQPAYDFSDFPDDDCTPYVQRITPPSELFEKDEKALKNAQATVDWMAGTAKECRKTLKSAAAKKALAEVVTACQMDGLSQIECALNKWSQKIPKKYPEGKVDYSIHNCMETAHNKALVILAQYLGTGVLFGKNYEQADAEALCAYVRDIACLYYDCHEDSLYYGWLRSVAAKHYDAAYKNDLRTRFEALGVIVKFANQSSETADDLDNIVSASTALEVVHDFQAALRITHVDRDKFDKDKLNYPRLRYFLDTAPQVFNFCAANSLSDVEAKLFNQQWAYWQQKNKNNQIVQTIWVDPTGIISVRIKANGQITVGFLRSNPYYANGWLDRNFLGDRTTEQLKLTGRYGSNYLVAIPAALNGDTPFWPDYQPRKKLMDDAHINK